MLGLEHSSDLADVRRAFRGLAKQHHPDAGGDGMNFIRLKQAYEDLVKHLSSDKSSSSSSGFDPFSGERDARRAWNRDERRAWYEEDEAEERFWDQYYREWNKHNSRHERHERKEKWKKREAREEESRHAKSDGKPRKKRVQFPAELRVVGSPAAGIFFKVQAVVNGQPAYERKSNPLYILFYSKKYKDWKIAQSLQDDGSCDVFGQALMGEYYDQDGSVTRIENEEEWSSPENWSTECLLHWCKARNIDTDDKFCKEDLVSLVNDMRPEESYFGDESSDEEDTRRRGGQTRWGFQIASRMKTDGAYRKPASMNPKTTIFGNRVEHMSISDGALWKWLNEEGDKSRVYSVWYNRDYCFSFFWRNKKWRRGM